MFKKGIIIIAVACMVCLTLLFYPFTSSFNPESLLSQAENYKKEGRYLEALSFYKDIYMNRWSDQVSASLYKGLADIYYEFLGDGENALGLYRKFMEKFPDESRTPSVYHSAAKIYFSKGEREKSIKFYKDILSVFPAYYKDNHIDDELQTLEKGGKLLDDVTLSVDRTFPSNIRVLVEESSESVEFSSDGVLGIFSPDSSFFRKVRPGKSVCFFAFNNSIYLEGYGPLNGPARIKTNDQNCVKVNGRSYRGFIWVDIRNDLLLVINHVGLEEYLYSVLPLEVSPSWPEHALKAQAVAARTYALYHRVKRQRETYDVFSTTSSQVYGGKQVEQPVTQNAVDLTKGLILTYDGKIVLALYHANSGGQTERVDDVWGGRLPYLSNIEDEFSTNQPGFSWEKTLSVDELQKRLKKFGLPVSSIVDIIPVEKAVSGRIKKLQIYQDKDSFYLTGNSFRLIVGPSEVKSSNFEVKREKKKFIFKGNGYGHGVGMSQWGAYEMAKRGNDFKKILRFYYPGTNITGIKVL